MTTDKTSSRDFVDEKGAPSEVDVTSVGDEYSEYLDLEAKFEADPAARKRLLWKSECCHPHVLATTLCSCVQTL